MPAQQKAVIVVFISLIALYSVAVWKNPSWYVAVFGILSLIGLFASILYQCDLYNIPIFYKSYPECFRE
jgi:Na+/H+ antiporter NhaD/arsenite permease-like protein